MPIPREQYDNQLDTLEFQVLNVLKARSKEALTLRDITSVMGLPNEFSLMSIVARFGVISALDSLARKGLIASKLVNHHAYYATS